jgi:group II intron reverse transcriptase/maturase
MLFCPLYRTLYTDSNLSRAWRSVRRQSKSAGIDAISTSQFDSRSFVYLKALQEELRRCRYRPGPVKRIFLRREVGPPRELGILSVRDRIVQRALTQILIPVFEPYFDDYSHAYRTGHSPQTAIGQARQHALAGRPWLVKIDLSDCFGSIPHRPLLRCVRERVRDFAVLRLLKRIVAAEVITESRSGSQQISKPRGLLQGSPLSPLLANIYLDKFDRAARSRELRFVRYGDDIAILTASRPEAEQARDVAVQIFERLHLQINRDKTKVYNLGKGCNYLGEWLALRKSSDGQWQVASLGRQPNER